MGFSAGSLDTAGRAAVGVIVGGGAALVGTLLAWSEQHPDQAVSGLRVPAVGIPAPTEGTHRLAVVVGRRTLPLKRDEPSRAGGEPG